MSFVVAVCALIALLAGGIAYLLLRRWRWAAAIVAGATFAATLGWFLHPVCVPLSAEDVARFSPPIDTRTDTGMIGQRLFQQRDGGWYQCKTWIARALFF